MSNDPDWRQIGSARGYLLGFARLAAPVMVQRASCCPLCLCIGALGGERPHLPRCARLECVELVALWIGHNHVVGDAILDGFMDDCRVSRSESFDRLSHPGQRTSNGSQRPPPASGPKVTSSTCNFSRT